MPAQSIDLTLSLLQLVGCTEEHLDEMPRHSGIKMHKKVIEPLMTLILASQQAGFDLRVASGFRSFERQRLIWNKKCLGERPILNNDGSVLNTERLSTFEKIEAILRWSALPGASRHHWGTECDIYDAAAMPEGYQLALHPDEYERGGLFVPMMSWLEGYLQAANGFSFYRPYAIDSGGVSPEPWHLSYQPIAVQYEQQFSLQLLKEHLQQLSSDHRIEDQDVVLEHLDTIYSRFILLDPLR